MSGETRSHIGWAMLSARKEALCPPPRTKRSLHIFGATVLFNGQVVPRDAFRQVVATRRAAFPDIRVTVEDQVAEGDRVSTRRTWEATHQGTYRGIAPTGKRVKWTQISIVRFADGRIVEDWPVADELGLLQQLGQPIG